MAIPDHILRNYFERQVRYLDAYDAGAESKGSGRKGHGKCFFCQRKDTQGLYILQDTGGRTYEVGPDCFTAYIGLNSQNIEELRELVRKERKRRGISEPVNIDDLEIDDYEGEPFEPSSLGAEEALTTERVGEEFEPIDGDHRSTVERQIKERRGQREFRDRIRERYGDRCMISGCDVMHVVEAAHIKPYRGDADNHPENGLLLRGDLHTLFDLDLIGIEPSTLIVRVHPELRRSGYEVFEAQSLRCSTLRPSVRSLEMRWTQFQKRLTS